MTCKNCGGDHNKTKEAFQITNSINETLNMMNLTLLERMIVVKGLNEQLNISIDEWNKYYKLNNKKLVVTEKIIKSSEKIVIEALNINKYRENFRQKLEQQKQKPNLSYVN